MIRTAHPLANRYNRPVTAYQQNPRRRNKAASKNAGSNPPVTYHVTLDVPVLKQSKLKDMGRKVVLTESETADLQNNLFRNAKANILNFDSLVDNYNAESCFQGTIGNAQDVDYYQINAVAQWFAHRPVYITMDAPVESGCRMTLYDLEGNQVGVSEPNEDGTQTLKVPCDWSNSKAFTLKIEAGKSEQENSHKMISESSGSDKENPHKMTSEAGGQEQEDFYKMTLESGRSEQEIPYKLTFRQGEIDPEFKAVLDKQRNVLKTAEKEPRTSEENAKAIQEVLQARKDKNDAKIKELHEKQYHGLPAKEQYRGNETAEELLARKRSGENLSRAEEAYLRIFGKLSDMVDTENSLRIDEIFTKLKEVLAEAEIRIEEGMKIAISYDGSVQVSGLTGEENAFAEKAIRENGLTGELKNAYFCVSETVKNMPDYQYKIAIYTDELNRMLSKASGGKVTVDDIRIVDRNPGTICDFYLEGLPGKLDHLINEPKEDSIYEDYSKMLYSVLEYRERQKEKPQFHVELEVGKNGFLTD